MKGLVLRWVVGTMIGQVILLLVLAIAIPLFLVTSYLPAAGCQAQTTQTFNTAQLQIAQTIVGVGRQQALPDRGIIEGLMAGIGESTLQNLDHGDASRNDTIGVFQIGPEHGTQAQRMDPAWSAGNFYARLTAVPDWQAMTETHAIHAAQRNADPEYYQQYLEDATRLFASMTGSNSPQTSCGSGPAVDSTGASGVTGWGGFVNGMIPANVLCPVPWLVGQTRADGTGIFARCDYVKALTALNIAFRAQFGNDIQISTAYRSQAYQADLCSRVTHACAKPGTSVHGWGLAIDFASGIGVDSSPQYAWMVANAGRYGIVHPGWSQKPGKSYEPWHWEFNPTLGEQTGVVTAADVAAAADTDPTTRPSNL